MMNKHYAVLSGATEDVVMPFELSGMHVDRKPPNVMRQSTELSGIGLEAPPIQPRPAPPELAPQYPPSQANLGSISKPMRSRRSLGGIMMYSVGFGALALLVYGCSRFLREEDD